MSCTPFTGLSNLGGTVHQTYDVTSYLKNENELTFVLLDGWYMGKLGYLNNYHYFGNQRKLLAQLEIEYCSGEKEIIGTDNSFRCSWDGPIIYSDLKDGEVFDANRVPTFAYQAKETTHNLKPIASYGPMIYEHETFIPELIVTPSGKKVLDFKQNLAGYISFKVKGEKGQVIHLQMGEVLDHGEFSRITLLEEGRPDNIKQEILFTCSGGMDYFHPEGFYSGFRYALIERMDEVDPNDFTAIAVYSDLEFTSEFSCSNRMINQFYKNTLWSLKSNFVDVPTDCPQREKSGWDGDAQIFCLLLYICVMLLRSFGSG